MKRDNDHEAWRIVLGGFEAALALDELSAGTRGRLIRCRSLLSAMARVPTLRTAGEPAPAPRLATVVPLRPAEGA